MSRLTHSVSVLSEAVAAFLRGEVSDSKTILAAVFDVNNEIGLLLRPSGDLVVRELQLKVNASTVAVKSADRQKIREAAEAVAKSVV